MGTNSIKLIKDDELCTGCGTCSAICPKDAIQMTIDRYRGIYSPKINASKCNKCGICYKICPGVEVNFKELSMEIFGEYPENKLIGNYAKCYIGYSNDPTIRYNSTSGGVITQLLIFALEEKIIDGALVTRMKKDNPLEPEPFIARTAKEIIKASNSKYCPVPANIALSKVALSKEGERFAVVGLPCHIHGIRKAERINEKLKNKIVLHIGIFCNHAPNFLATEYMLEKVKINTTDVEELRYREKGWPGKMNITLKNGKKSFDYGEYWSSVGNFFYPVRCTGCCDHTAELADISCGDAWIPEIQNKDDVGTSIIISRTESSEKLIEDAKKKNKITLEPIDSSRVIESQKQAINFKKRGLKSRMVILKIFGNKTPYYETYGLSNPTLAFFLSGISTYTKIYLSSKRELWNLLICYQSLKSKIMKCIKKLIT